MADLSTEKETFVFPVFEAEGRLDALLELWRSALAQTGTYALCVGGTETSDIEGISAAGADSASRRLTPAIDAEAIVLGRPVSASSLPRSPKGVVSPVVLSRAMLSKVQPDVEVFDCGSFVPPKVSAVTVGTRPARRLDSGHALPLALVNELFESGLQVGTELARTSSYVLVAECVPGGTTTALGVLTGLGYPAANLVSSSMPQANHDQRRGLVQQGLQNAEASHVDMLADPLKAVAAVGDPMQPFAAGLAIAAAERVPVVLGGGTQMLAVYSLAKAMVGREINELRLGVVTTKWVAFDPLSNPLRLAELVNAPFAAACPDFTLSQHEGLRMYEDGNVKEGVGAGALMAAAFLRGLSPEEICSAIDASYNAMVNGRD